MIVNELDVRLSAVRRWPVSLTIRQQSVAEHQHNVCMIAERIGRKWFGLDEARLYRLMRYALYHDYKESYTSDMPSYMKRWVMPGAEDDFESVLDEDVDMGSITMDDLLRGIVKVADYIDAAVFLRVEISMGNKTVAAILRDLEDRFKHYCAEFQYNGVSAFSQVFNQYQVEVLDQLFNSNGQMVIEGFRFK